jgi:hypothetical protein
MPCCICCAAAAAAAVAVFPLWRPNQFLSRSAVIAISLMHGHLSLHVQVSFLAALVVSCEHTDRVVDARVVLAHTTGSIEATAHRRVLAAVPSFAAGAAVIVKKARTGLVRCCS